MRILVNIFSVCLFFVYSIDAADPITNNTEITYDVIVVGAGLTGLTAARRIQMTRPELRVLVLEARGMVGGRIRYSSMQTRNGIEFVDIGSQFISPNDQELLELLNEINVTTTRQLNCGENVVFQQERNKRQAGLQAQWQSTHFDDFLSNGELLANLTNVSITQYSNTLNTPDADSINRLMQTFYDAPGENVAQVQLALTCSSQNSTTIQILRNFGHGNSLLSNVGMNEVARRLADGLLIEYNQRVVSVNDAASPSVVTTSSGTFYTARQVIVAVPVATLSNIRIVPQVETPFAQLIQNYYPTGHAYYFSMTFQRPTWRLNGKSGRVIYTSQRGPLVWLTTFDTTLASSCESASNSSSTLWGIAHFSYEVPFETRRSQYTQAIMYSMRFADFSPIDVSDVSFSNDDLARGTIPTLRVNVPVESLKYLDNFHTVYQNVHISTADLASVSLGTMNGAVHAGHSVAYHVLSVLTEADSMTNGVLHDTPLETSTPFVYHTSSHYPPSMFETSSPSAEPISESAQHLNPLRDEQSGTSTTFRYETSSHYPSTQAPTTTTMKHFSFGNLDDTENKNNNNNATEVKEDVNVVAYESIPLEQTPRGEGFVYKTSTQWKFAAKQHPTRQVLRIFETLKTKYLDETSRVAESVPVNQNTNNFVYSTTTHYPPSALAVNDINLRATPPPQVIEQLHDVSDKAANTSSVELAYNLNSLVNVLLTGLRLR
ncbi:unnamed protein product [Caenorhabditis bovis]|uniref:monoamine oxidase n=1 Tax=Caenorhabditis bovis TaxID=2654633 RepID=A0A8S1F353_9PELO|nr:unnamed protein product [Caenorhabditis bovis]